MPDPRARDPRFPDRPTHPDFIRLSEAVQTHDAMAEQLGVNPFAVLGVDEESLLYFLKNRMGMVSQRMHRDFTHPRFSALYLDAFALGKRYAEMVQEEPDEDDVTVRPTGSCDCGYPVVWVAGHWEHDAAPYLWGDDHDAGVPEPEGPAREYWDREDGVT